jgi:putative ABC transport system permease protein
MTELRLIVRTLVAQPGFSCLVVLAFGLGVGANTAIFSAVHGLLLRTPPFRDVDRLVQITTVRGDEGGTDTLRAPPSGWTGLLRGHGYSSDRGTSLRRARPA